MLKISCEAREALSTLELACQRLLNAAKTVRMNEAHSREEIIEAAHIIENACQDGMGRQKHPSIYLESRLLDTLVSTVDRLVNE